MDAREGVYATADRPVRALGVDTHKGPSRQPWAFIPRPPGQGSLPETGSVRYVMCECGSAFAAS